MTILTGEGETTFIVDQKTFGSKTFKNSLKPIISWQNEIEQCIKTSKNNSEKLMGGFQPTTSGSKERVDGPIYIYFTQGTQKFAENLCDIGNFFLIT